MTTPRRLRSTWLPLLAGLLVSALATWLVLRDLSAAHLTRALAMADFGWAILGVAAIIATFFSRAWRWAALLQPMRYRAPTIMAALLTGQVINFLLPLRLGDVARSVALGRAPGSSIERVLGSLAVEKVWDWLALTALVLIVALSAPVPDWFVGPARVFGIVALLLIAALWVILRWRERGIALLDRVLSPRPLRAWMLQRVTRLLDGMDSLQQREAAWRAGLGTLITWSLGVAANVAVQRVFGLQSWPAAMFLMAVLMVGVAIPPSIAALGIFEALSVLALGAFGVPRETALAIGVTLHLVIFVTPAVCASLLVAWESRHNA